MNDKAKVLRLRATLREIRGLLEWHFDPDADPDDASPEDTTAHVNGVVIQLIDAALAGTEGKRETHA